MTILSKKLFSYLHASRSYELRSIRYNAQGSNVFNIALLLLETLIR